MLIWVNFLTSSSCVFITTCCFFHMLQEYFQCSILTFHSPKELLWETAFIRFLIKWKDWAQAKKSIKLLILIHPKSFKCMYICMWKLLYYHCSRIVYINNASHCRTSILVLAGEASLEKHQFLFNCLRILQMEMNPLMNHVLLWNDRIAEVPCSPNLPS